MLIFFVSSLEKISADLMMASATSLEDANRLANLALAALRKRRADLLEVRQKCGRLAQVESRRQCFVSVQRQVRTLRKERQLIDALRACNTKAGDMGRLVHCVTETRRRHKLLAPDGMPRSEAEASTLVSSVQKVVAAVSSHSDLAEEEAEEAVRQVKERLERIASHWSLCQTLDTPEMRNACRHKLIAMRDEVKRERELVYRLERCGELFAFENKARERCAQLVGKQILRLVRGQATTARPETVLDTTQPPVVNEAPENLEDLKLTEHQAKLAIEDRIASLHNAMKGCGEKNMPCKIRLHKLLARARDELEVLPERFEPRKQCLIKRKKFQLREFRLRALEHARMYQLHRKAAQCETRRCLRRWENLEWRLNVLLSRRRAARHREWKRIRCFFVLPFRAVAPEQKNYGTLAGLHFRVHELYNRLRRCKTRVCEDNLEALVSIMQGQITRVTRYLQEKDFVDRIRRHRSRARQNRKFTQLYRRALDCPTLDCRRETRFSLDKLQRELDEEERNYARPEIDHHVA